MHCLLPSEMVDVHYLQRYCLSDLFHFLKCVLMRRECSPLYLNLHMYLIKNPIVFGTKTSEP